MKKTYINPACKVRTMKIEAILANTIKGGEIDGDDGIGFGGGAGGNGGGGGAGGFDGDPDVNRKSLWDEE